MGANFTPFITAMGPPCMIKHWVSQDFQGDVRIFHHFPSVNPGTETRLVVRSVATIHRASSMMRCREAAMAARKGILVVYPESFRKPGFVFSC